MYMTPRARQSLVSRRAQGHVSPNLGHVWSQLSLLASVPIDSVFNAVLSCTEPPMKKPMSKLKLRLKSRSFSFLEIRQHCKQYSQELAAPTTSDHAKEDTARLGIAKQGKECADDSKTRASMGQLVKSAERTTKIS